MFDGRGDEAGMMVLLKMWPVIDTVLFTYA